MPKTSYFLPKWKCEPRKEAGPRLKSTLKKPKAEIVDWRPFEDEGIDVGETVFVGWVLEEEPEEPDGDPPDPEVNSVAMANLEQAEKKAVEDKPAEDETGSGTPDPRYARLFTDAKLDAMGVVADVAGVMPRPSPLGRKAFRKEAIRRVAREAVYRMLKKAKKE
ncbi:hypothetical protein PC128_g15984 [Phytophthora cactorum]|nr:hypothetical protein PC128_g15984 [Phytophthora cactorum]